MKKEELEFQIHTLWWGVCNYLKKWYYDLQPGFRVVKDKDGKVGIEESKRKYKQVNFNEVVGYQALARMDKFSRENPDIITVGCDDSFHSGSTLYLIPHKTEEEYWGTSVLYIPQNGGDRNLFFLYPCHLKELLKALNRINEEYETLRAKEKRDEEE